MYKIVKCTCVDDIIIVIAGLKSDCHMYIFMIINIVRACAGEVTVIMQISSVNIHVHDCDQLRHNCNYRQANY